MQDHPDNFQSTDLGTVALLGSANLDLLADTLVAGAREWSVALAPQVGTYGRANIDLRDPSSDLARALTGGKSAAVIFERAEDLLGDLVHRPVELARNADVAALAAPMLDMIRAARRAFDGPVLVFSVAAFAPSTLGLADDGAEMGLAPALARLNAHIRDQIAALDGVHWIETGRLIAEVGLQAAAPGMFWYAARAPFSQAFAACLSRRVIGALLALEGRTARLLVLDLDNTLWGGVVGEDGIGGLKLGDGWPGAAFREFQNRIKGLSDRGVVLAVASKNDEDLALKAMETHPDMVIRPADLAAHRIGWGEKWQSITAMLDELSLGAANCMFLDDNPVERAKVRSHLPQVQVPDLPEAVADWPGILDRHPFLECLTLTKSDIGRAATYRTRARIARAQDAAEDLDAFFRSLDLKVTFEPYAPANRQRIEQLIVKTNQFNATTRRHDAAALARIVEEGGKVFATGVEDKFSPYEIMGVIILRADDAMRRAYGDDLSGVADTQGAWWVDSFMLSCRILGRGVERAILWQAAQLARGQGATGLVGQIIDTPRNTPVRKVFAEAGFDALAETGAGGVWHIPLAGDAPGPDLPDYIAVDMAEMAGAFDGRPVKAVAAAAPSPLSTSPLSTSPLATSPLATSPLATQQPTASPLATVVSAEGPPPDADLDAIFRRKMGLDASADLSTVTMDNTPAWDSLRHVSLAMELETTLKLRLPMDTLFSIRSYQDLCRAAARFG